MKDVYNSIEKYNPGKEQKILIVFDDMIAAIISNKRLKIFVINICLVFTKQYPLFYHDSKKPRNTTRCY